jgi:flavin reductase (DIM6/NTAB) family NADH-FMN oxidoreductase RutF
MLSGGERRAAARGILSSMPSAEADRQRFRAVMGHFATGVAVVTAQGGNGVVGMTTNALTSVSLEPLLLLVCFDNTARTLPVVRETERFGVNVLRAGQEGVSGQFASKLPLERKFDAVDYTLDRGAPVLDDALAWLVCDLRELLPGGDHTIGIGAVRAMGHGEGDPLVWYRGGYTSLTWSPP